MSYILDALRRADSERERGAVPSLHAKPVPPALADGDDDEEATPRPNHMLWAVIGLSLVLAGVLGWQLLGGGAVAEPPAPLTPMPPPPPAAAVPTSPAPTPQAAQPAPPLVVQAPPEAPSVQAKVERKPAAAKEPAKASAPVAADERPVSTFNELPDSIRRELPQLVIGGAMYSQTPANRMLILNGQVFHEGDKVAGELVLEQIRLKSAVLSYKGHRYSINY